MEAALRSLRERLGGVGLIAVTKYASFESLRRAYSLGVRDFGESRVQEAADKARACIDGAMDGIRWHFIGRIQSNKVAKLFGIRSLAAVHSVGSLGLLEKMAAKEALLSAPLGVFLQVAMEEGKNGFSSRRQLWEAVRFLRKKEAGGIRLRGLMCMARPGRAAEDFGRLLSWRDSIDPSLKLSMGMSQDYEEALAHGTDYVRIGSLLFGSLPKDS